MALSSPRKKTTSLQADERRRTFSCRFLRTICDWYQLHWTEAEEVRDEILTVIELHLKPYTPFEIYAKALYEYYLSREMPTGSWEETESKIYPILDDLQRDGYRKAVYISEQWGGALICDGVGFGKTYIGLMLVERFLHSRMAKPTLT
jgi:hypothetical protein